MKKRKHFVLTIILCMTITLISGCGQNEATSSGNESTDDILKVGLDFSSYETIDVMKTTYTDIFQISDCICETLMGKDPKTLETFPLLVKDFPEVSEDGLTYKFNLKENVKFHDGTILDTEDVLYTFERIFNPNTMSPMAWLVEMIEGAKEYTDGKADTITGIKAIDENIFTIKLTYKYSPFVATLAASPLAIISKDACEAAGDNWGISQYIGTGPFALEGFESGSKIILKRNEEYHNGPKEISGIDFISLDASTALLEFEAGNIDLCGFSNELAEEYKSDEKYSKNVNYQNYFGVYTLILNQGIEPLNDKRVREAFSLSIDRVAIAQDYFNGNVTEAYTFLPPGIAGHDDALVYKRDIEKAKKLLSDAGYSEGITITTYIPENDDVLTVVKEQVSEAGINLDIKLADAATVSDMRTNGKLAFWTLMWYADYNDADEFLYGVFHSNMANFFSTGFKDSDFDKKLDEARGIIDANEKTKIYKQLDHEITYEKIGNVPMYFPGSYYLVSDRVSNIGMKKDFLLWLVDAKIA